MIKLSTLSMGPPSSENNETDVADVERAESTPESWKNINLEAEALRWEWAACPDFNALKTDAWGSDYYDHI